MEERTKLALGASAVAAIVAVALWPRRSSAAVHAPGTSPQLPGNTPQAPRITRTSTAPTLSVTPQTPTSGMPVYMQPDPLPALTHETEPGIIRTLQLQLNQMDDYRLTPDGNPGPATNLAVNHFLTTHPAVDALVQAHPDDIERESIMQIDDFYWGWLNGTRSA